MNKEIKEILARLKNNDFEIDCNDGSCYKELYLSEIEQLLDYITNLEQLEQDHKQANATLMQELTKKDIALQNAQDDFDKKVQENENQKELIRKQSKRNSRQRLANTKQQDLILKLQQENERLKERVAYLERSNNRREDTIIGLRFEVAEQEDYKQRCEKASDKSQELKDSIDKSNFDGMTKTILILGLNQIQGILQGSDDNEC